MVGESDEHFHERFQSSSFPMNEEILLERKVFHTPRSFCTFIINDSEN
jgi:hypothetical protein